MVKLIIFAAAWFAFGVFTGWKIFHSLISIDISDDFTDEEVEEILDKIMEKMKNEKK